MVGEAEGHKNGPDRALKSQCHIAYLQSADQIVLVSLQFMDADGKERKTYVTKLRIPGSSWYYSANSVSSVLATAVKEAEESTSRWNVASTMRFCNTFDVYINIKGEEPVKNMRRYRAVLVPGRGKGL